MANRLERSIVVLGRSSDCDIVLPESFARVSRHHAEIRREHGGFVLYNRSSNGTWVNNERVERRPLREGDRITLAGQADFVFQGGALQGPGSSRLARRRPPPWTTFWRRPAASPNSTPLILVGGGLAVLLLVLLAVQGLRTDPLEIARTVAERWVAGNAATMANEITAAAGGRVPLEEPVLRDKIAEQIRQRSAWTFNEPEKVTEDTYRVLATVQINLRIIDAGSFGLTVPYQFTIDTGRRAVRQYEQGEVDIVGR